MDPFQSLYYVSPACMMCLVVPFFIVELPGVRALMVDPNWTFRPAVFLANAFAAFLLNLAVFLLIGKTSALTMNIAGVIKDWTLIYSSYSVFKAPVTALNLAGMLRFQCIISALSFVFEICTSGFVNVHWCNYSDALPLSEACNSCDRNILMCPGTGSLESVVKGILCRPSAEVLRKETFSTSLWIAPHA